MHLIKLENTDAWFVSCENPPQDLSEAVMITDEVTWDDACEMIDTGLAKEQSRYLFNGGTLVTVYAITEKPTPKTAG